MRNDDQVQTSESEATTTPAPKAKETTTKKKPPVETKKVRSGTDNVVTITDIAKELKIDPAKARAKLRALKLKHAHGASWEWPKGSATIKEVKALLRD